tara:strand:+ start:5207 stop:5497 length:291 start_codon:yes stop_codon:yes gene_type:complete
MSKLSRIEFKATPAERKRLDIEAAAHGMTRQELIRERVLMATPETPKFTADVSAIDRAVQAVSRQHVGLPRHALQPIVCTVICSLVADSERAGTPD